MSINSSSDYRVFFERLFRVEHGEWPRLLLAFFTFFLILGCWFMLRPIRGTVAANNSDILPWLYTATFTSMLIVVPIFGFLVARFPRRIFLPAVYFFFVANILLFAWLFRGEQTNLWIQRSFYVWASVFNLFVYSLFWSYMADIFRSSQAQRLFGSIMAGGSFGAMLGPLFTSQMASRIGSQGIMLVAAGVLTVATLMAISMRRLTRPENIQRQSRVIGGSIWEGARRVFRSRYLIFICLLMLTHNLTATFLYNGLAILVDQNIVGFDARTEFFSYIDVIVQILAFAFQFFITTRLLSYLGMPKTVIIIPLVLTGGMVLLGSALTVVLFAGVHIAQRALNYGMIGPTKEMLFTVVDRETKYKCKNFIDTVIYRGSDVSASWAVKGLMSVGLTLSNIAWMLVPVMLVWSVIAWKLGQQYEQLKRYFESELPQQS